MWQMALPFRSRITNTPLCEYTTSCLPRSPVKGPLVRSCLLAVVNNVAANTGMQISLCALAFDPFGDTPRRGISGSRRNAVFNFFEKLPSCFPSWLHKGSKFSTSLTFVIFFLSFPLFRCLSVCLSLPLAPLLLLE